MRCRSSTNIKTANTTVRAMARTASFIRHGPGVQNGPGGHALAQLARCNDVIYSRLPFDFIAAIWLSKVLANSRLHESPSSALMML